LPLVGEFSPAKFREQYSFLEDAHTRELKTVRDHVKRAQTLLKKAPDGLREGWEEELSRLELAKKKAESAVDQDRRRKIDQEALKQLTKEEKEKRLKGKKGWWMKDCE
jgi:ribosomal RNA-processing protein 36